MLYKQKNSKYWWVKLKSQGRVYRKSSGHADRRKAESVEKEFQDELWRAKYLSKGKTFGDAAIRWVEDHEHKKSLETDLMILKWLLRYLDHTLLTEITRDRVEELRKLKTGKPATVNRYMALLRSILKISKDDWEWLEKIPKVPMYHIPEREPRWLSSDEFLSIVSELPAHLQGPAWFSVETGLRARPIRKLQWSWIYRDGLRIPASIMKAAKFLTIPLSQTAWHVLAEQWGTHPNMVFVTDAGKIWQGQFTTRAWRKACKRAGLEGTQFHDLRRTWASWKVQAGVPLNVVQELGGWSSYEMTQVYAHLAPATLQEWVEKGHS